MAAKTYDEIKKLVADNNKSSDIMDRLFICLIWKESTFDPDLKNSGSSATGLMQLTKGAIAEVNRVKKTSYNHDDMTDPGLNIEVGTTYIDILKHRNGGKLAVALDKFGTGKGYSDSIIACSLCMKKDDTHPMVCLHKIHR
jgi:hypothetical protein